MEINIVTTGSAVGAGALGVFVVTRFLPGLVSVFTKLKVTGELRISDDQMKLITDAQERNTREHATLLNQQQLQHKAQLEVLNKLLNTLSVFSERESATARALEALHTDNSQADRRLTALERAVVRLGGSVPDVGGDD